LCPGARISWIPSYISIISLVRDPNYPVGFPREIASPTVRYTLHLSGTPCIDFARNFLPGNAGLSAVAVAGLNQAAKAPICCH
jgi:hypothetical protein